MVLNVSPLCSLMKSHSLFFFARSKIIKPTQHINHHLHFLERAPAEGPTPLLVRLRAGGEACSQIWCSSVKAEMSASFSSPPPQPCGLWYISQAAVPLLTGCVSLLFFSCLQFRRSLCSRAAPVIMNKSFNFILPFLLSSFFVERTSVSLPSLSVGAVSGRYDGGGDFDGDSENNFHACRISPAVATSFSITWKANNSG